VGLSGVKLRDLRQFSSSLRLSGGAASRRPADNIRASQECVVEEVAAVIFMRRFADNSFFFQYCLESPTGDPASSV